MVLAKQRHIPMIAWLCGALFYFYQFVLRVSPGVMTEHLQETFSVDFCAVGVISAFYYHAYTLFQLPAGVLLDKYGPRRVLLTAILACGVGAWCFAWSLTPAVASVGRFLMGAGSAFAFLGCVKIATVSFDLAKLPFFVGCTIFLGCTGAAIGTGPFSWALTHFGWRGTMELLAYVSPLLFVLCWFFLTSGKDSEKESVEAAHISHPDVQPSVTKGIFIILKNPQSWVLGAYGFLMYVVLSVWADLWGVSFLVAQYQIDQTAASHLASLFYVGMAVCSPVVYLVVKLFKSYRRCMILSAFASTVTASLICFVHFPAPEIVGGLLFLLGGLSTGQFLAFSVVCEVNPPHVSATASAIQNMICMLSGVVMQPAVGWVLDWTKHLGAASYAVSLSIVPLCTLLACGLVLFVRETYGHESGV